MSATETFQITLEEAEAYEEKFVPALFAEWAHVIADAAGVRPGQDVLDVACGTGIVAGTIADRLSKDGKVVGVDLNEAMLTVARRVRPEIDWKQGDVADLPFPDDSFDVVLCQMALMFFPDRLQALREMRRVSRETVALVVPSSLHAQAAWGPFVAVAARHAGQEALSLLGTYWSCGDADELRRLLKSAGLEVTDVQARMGTAHFPSVDALVGAEVESTPLKDRISDDVYRKILEDTRAELDPFTTPNGSLEAPIECLVARASKTAKGSVSAG